MFSLNNPSRLCCLALLLGSAGAIHADFRTVSSAGPQVLGSGLTVRDAHQWARGYYPGDALPAATVYLTFDDGPGDFTAEILDILKEADVRASFFINSFDRDGPAIADPAVNGLLPYGALLRRMVAEGHSVGNHTFSHQAFISRKNGSLAFQLETLQKHFSQAYGPGAPRLWLVRPPFGAPWLGNWGSAAQREEASKELGEGSLVCLWTMGWDSADSADWVQGEWYKSKSPRYRPTGKAYLAKIERLNDRILKHADGNASGVILMHDMHPTTRDSLRTLIRELKSRAYRFATMDDYANWRWGEFRVAQWRLAPPTPEARPVKIRL